jgi:hypothetical protein
MQCIPYRYKAVAGFVDGWRWRADCPAHIEFKVRTKDRIIWMQIAWSFFKPQPNLVISTLTRLGTTVASLPLKTALGLSPEQKMQLD